MVPLASNRKVARQFASNPKEHNHAEANEITTRKDKRMNFRRLPTPTCFQALRPAHDSGGGQNDLFMNDFRVLHVRRSVPLLFSTWQ